MNRFMRRKSTSKRPPGPSILPNLPFVSPLLPTDTDFAQMRLKTWPEAIKPLYVAIILAVLGIFFIPAGVSLMDSSNDVFEQTITYDDGTNSSACFISESNQGRVCEVTFRFEEDVTGPVRMYYKMENFFQNHRRYYQSKDNLQLQGEVLSESDVELTCSPLYKNGTQLLNPCGLVANSFFTDVFTVPSPAYPLDETDISLPSDRISMYNQVEGFLSVQVANESVSCASAGLPDSCQTYTADDGVVSLFYYPQDDTTQYLYETYPAHISPLEGVMNEHFIVWMRAAMLPTFRKLYGVFHNDFHAGDTLTVQVTANYEVGSLDATKSLLLSTLGDMGGKNIVPGQLFLTVGSLCLAAGSALLLREVKHHYF